jgi:hypothetical protein
VAESQNASICFASNDSNGSQSPPTHEQQIGVVREYVLRADRSKDECNGSGSRSSSLQRRGAVRRKKGPIADQKNDDEDESDSSGSDLSSLCRRGAVKHKRNPVSVRTTHGEFDHFRDHFVEV